MSKNKSFSDTSANRYSLALYELAKESSELDEIEKNSFSLIQLIFNNNEFQLFDESNSDLESLTLANNSLGRNGFKI